MRTPIVPTEPEMLNVGLAPRPFPQSIAETRLPISHHSRYWPISSDSQHLPLPQSSRDRLWRSSPRASGPRPSRGSRGSSSRHALSGYLSSPSPRPESSDPTPSTAHPKQEPRDFADS